MITDLAALHRTLVLRAESMRRHRRETGLMYLARVERVWRQADRIERLCLRPSKSL